MSTPSKTAVQAARKRLHWAKSRKIKIVVDTSRLRNVVKRLECFASLSHEAALIVEELFCIWGRSLKTDAKRRGDTLRVTVNANVDVYRVIDTAEIAFASGPCLRQEQECRLGDLAKCDRLAQPRRGAACGEPPFATGRSRKGKPSSTRRPTPKIAPTLFASLKNSKRAKRGKANR